MRTVLRKRVDEVDETGGWNDGGHDPVKLMTEIDRDEDKISAGKREPTHIPVPMTHIRGALQDALCQVWSADVHLARCAWGGW
jgi:hypothetical protein